MKNFHLLLLFVSSLLIHKVAQAITVEELEAMDKAFSESCHAQTAENCPPGKCQLMKTCSGEAKCQSLFSPNPPACGKHGYYGQQVECCPSHVRRCGMIKADGSCDMKSGGYGEGFPYCLSCGDGVCAISEDRCNCPEDCKASSDRPQIRYSRERLSQETRTRAPGILMNPVNEGDIPQFAKLLEKAYEKKDPTICQKLPEPEEQTFFHGDYSTKSPPRRDWVSYCMTLIAQKPSQCNDIGRYATPNLRQSCSYFFKAKAASKNSSPEFCLDHAENAFSSSDEVGNCLGNWAHKTFAGYRREDEIAVATTIEPFSELLLKTWLCFRHPKPSSQTKGKMDRHKCLFELATSSKDQRLCQLIDNPYYNKKGSNVWSKPNCLEVVGKAQKSK